MQDQGQLGHYGKTIKFDSAGARAAFLADFFEQNVVPRLFGSGQVIREYDAARFDLAGNLARLIAEKGLAPPERVAALPSLSELHRILPPELTALDDTELNRVSQAFYDTDERFLAVYRALIKQALSPLFGADLLFQSTPTIRFHFPHQKGFLWRPRYHTDIMLGHPPQEVNVWLPLTRSFGTNSMCIAPLEDSLRILGGEDYDFDAFALRTQTDEAFSRACAAASRPVELEPGQFLMFDPRCLHATQYNDTDATRISIDFRVIPVAEFDRIKNEYRGTGRRRMLFAPGHYYDARPASAF